MGFENKAGLNVSNFYGARNTGGTRGIVKTEGTYNEFSTTVPLTGTIDFKFPVLKGVKVVGFYAGDATGANELGAILGCDYQSAGGGGL